MVGHCGHLYHRSGVVLIRLHSNGCSRTAGVVPTGRSLAEPAGSMPPTMRQCLLVFALQGGEPGKIALSVYHQPFLVFDIKYNIFQVGRISKPYELSLASLAMSIIRRA